MADPYYPYSFPAAADGASIARTSFAGYIPTEPSNSTELRGTGSDYLQRDIGLFYSADDTLGSRVHSEPVKGYSPLADPDLTKKRDMTPLGISHGVSDVNSERASSKNTYDGLPISAADSNILFVGGLPNNCTRREVGHLFRPFIGYKDIRVVHKEPRRSDDKAMTLCFVEFVDSKCALTALEALQGYKFDDKKPDSPTLKIQFAHFPFRLPSDHGNSITT
ncbi:nuclear speckle RNA-binding protein B [Vigna radiata var. radiata]|uniref:Nuclear speckle RNA-binding protein B n=1 Tax=Vigna radiata var. radiata TaxID=3916 RepID=A0A1S3U8C3_VIGRR|nr:nuclear speckle RNA-binding protein B [Vigna radiata var. radiata]